MNKFVIFIFHRDLRLCDNIGLLGCSKLGLPIFSLFIFDDRLIKNNEYASKNAIEFMVQSLIDLNKQLEQFDSKLFIFEGLTQNIIESILSTNQFSAVYSNQDYTPFSQQRDAEISAVCKKYNVDFKTFHDALLLEPGSIKSGNNKIYTVFTPFYKKATQLKVPKPQPIPPKIQFIKSKQQIEIKINLTIDGNVIHKKYVPEPNPHLAEKGGRSEALKILRDLENFSNYEIRKDIPSIQGTLRISAHLKFGTISPRELFYELEDRLEAFNPIIRQLYWRDFFTHIAYFHPHVFGNAFKKEYNNLEWENSQQRFKAWREGQTGFPIVDAGMRELNETGYMHNRVRMIVSSFLVKDLHIDWRWGEKYFATKLVDYDPSLNNGNWQWAASTGCDAQPYFRIFNPWNQQKKFDPECIYIKQWIPELRDLDPTIIHNFEKIPPKKEIKYPAMIVDHKNEVAKTLLLYKKILK